MSRQEAIVQYGKALKEGRRCYRECVSSGRYPYPQVLEEILQDADTQGTVELGEVEIPMDQIVGTRVSGRKASFAADFMPLLDVDSEFGVKWVALCEAHLGDEGITDPIRAYEYLGRFYVQEGNKRVSVLKSYGAVSIRGTVTRILPAWSDDMAIRVYFEFLDFYALSGIYQVHFNEVGGYPKIQAALGFDPDHIWTEDERRSFISDYYRFKRVFLAQNVEGLPVTTAEALLVWLQVYQLSDLKAMSEERLKDSLSSIWKDVEAVAKGGPISVSTEPDVGSTGVIAHIIKTVRPQARLKVAFVYERDPEESLSLSLHDQGRHELEQSMEDRVEVSVHIADADTSSEAAMDEAAEAGADVIFATSAAQLLDCRKVAARHPGVKVLNCSIAMPYPGVRTYYGRAFETAFICGAVAGALSHGEDVGYIANAPLLGVPAEINAFALGAQLTSPETRVRLDWSGVHADAFERFASEGLEVISNADIPTPSQAQNLEGLCRVCGAERVLLALPTWSWGTFYTKLVKSILHGSWGALEAHGDSAAVNYWWGIGSGVMDVTLGETLPSGVRALADLLREDLAHERINIFHRAIARQDGTVANDGSRWLSTDDILGMDWLCSFVDGRIPAFDELLPAARELDRIEGIHRKDIPPEKGGPVT